MARKFMIECRVDGPIATAHWYPWNLGMTMKQSEVEYHCRTNQIDWQKGLYRLIELKPIKVEFKTIIDLTEA